MTADKKRSWHFCLSFVNLMVAEFIEVKFNEDPSLSRDYKILYKVFLENGNQTNISNYFHRKERIDIDLLLDIEGNLS